MRKTAVPRPNPQRSTPPMALARGPLPGSSTICSAPATARRRSRWAGEWGSSPEESARGEQERLIPSSAPDATKRSVRRLPWSFTLAPSVRPSARLSIGPRSRRRPRRWALLPAAAAAAAVAAAGRAQLQLLRVETDSQARLVTPARGDLRPPLLAACSPG